MNWFTQLFAGRQMKSDLAEEMRSHLEEKIEALMAQGLSRKEAGHAARRAFGNVTALEERSRETWGWPAIELIVGDLRYALRRLSKTPGFTLVALLTLALGIGANTGMFTLLNAVLLKSLPVPAPEQLFLVKQSGRTAEKSRFSAPLFQQLRQQLPNDVLMAAMSWPVSFYVAIGNQAPERVTGQLVSGGYFQAFETYAVLGRLLVPEDDAKLSASPLAVLSYSYWRSHFASDPNVIGRKLSVNSVPFTIVGVAAPGFFGVYPGTEPDFWMPLTMQSDVKYQSHSSTSLQADPSKPWVPQDTIKWLQLVARVKDAGALPRLTAVMSEVYRQDRESRAHRERDPQQQLSIRRSYLALEPGQQGFATLRQEFRQPLLLLMGMAAMVLLIACANIANLLLARAVARERAIAVQLAIGASRQRLLRQMLIESLLLSFGGGLCGIAVAFWCCQTLPKWASSTAVPIPLNLVPDGRVLLFSLLLALVTGVLFGLAPAWQSTRIDPAGALKSNARSVHGPEHGGRWSLRKNLVICQVALSLILLVGAGMFLRTLLNYAQLDPGFDRDHLVSAHLDTHLVNYQPQEFLPLYQRLIDRIGAIPGVRSASVASCALVSGCFDSSDVILVDQKDSQAKRVNAQVNDVSLDYFKTIGLHLRRGRDLDSRDNLKSPNVALVNETFARRSFANGNAVGRRFAYDVDDPQSFEIVGVVSDARVNDVKSAAPPVIYFPMAQNAGNIDSIDIRAAGYPERLIAQVRSAVLDVDHRLPIIAINTLSEQVDRNLTQPRLIARLTIAFGLLALALACLGLYGVMSYTVQRRTGEIGIRLALGSNRSGMLWLVLREALVLVATGALFGLALSAATMRLLTNFLYGLSPEDPLTMALAGALLLAVSMASGFIPAWKASRVDPIEALRFE